MGLIARFSSRKRKAEVPLYIGPVTVANENNYENVHMGSKKGARCKWHGVQQIRKENVYGCWLCSVHLCRDECHIAYHNQQHFCFFKLPLISYQNFS